MLYPNAVNRLLPAGVNHNSGGNTPKLFIIHIIVGNVMDADRIFNDPAKEASAHFGVAKGGTVTQWVSTDDIAWHAFSANDHSIGVEHAGSPPDSLTSAQIEATGKLYAWAHGFYPVISLWLCTREVGSGLAYHRQFHNWNLDNHTCPGDNVIPQLPDILAVAQAQ